MDEDKIIEGAEIHSELNEQVMSEISSLRDELTAIRRMLELDHSIKRAINEYCYLPPDLENPIRWGFIGAWGKGGVNSEVDVLTFDSADKFFDHPYASDENVAAFARAFTNPNTIKIWKYLFRGGKSHREEIMKACDLSDEELDAAVKPLLEGHFARWDDGKLKRTSHNYVITLIAMTRTAIDHHKEGI